MKKESEKIMKMKKRLLALYTAILSASCCPVFADYIDNDGAIDVSSAVTTLTTNIYSVANQVFPVIIAVVIVMFAIKIFRRTAK